MNHKMIELFNIKKSLVLWSADKKLFGIMITQDMVSKKEHQTEKQRECEAVRERHEVPYS